MIPNPSRDCVGRQELLVPGLNWEREPLSLSGTKQNYPPCCFTGERVHWDGLGQHPHLHWQFPSPSTTSAVHFSPLASLSFLLPSSTFLDNPSYFSSPRLPLPPPKKKRPATSSRPLHIINTTTVLAHCSGLTVLDFQSADALLITPNTDLHSMTIPQMSSYTIQSPEDTL